MLNDTERDANASLTALREHLAAANERAEAAEARSESVDDLTAELESLRHRVRTLPGLLTLNPNISARVRAMLRTVRWAEGREKVEIAFNMQCSSDPHDHAEGRRNMAAWTAYMKEASHGLVGVDMILFGRHMLECIQALQDGQNPGSDEYLTRFVDGMDRRENNPATE